MEALLWCGGRTDAEHHCYLLRLPRCATTLCSTPTNLVELKEPVHGEELVGPGLIASEGLSALAVEVELRYFPGHSGITGNLKADLAARRGARHSVRKRKVVSLVNECVGKIKDDI